MNFFAIDNPVMRFLGRVGDLIVLNLVFVVTSLPVITIGTAFSALYTVTMKIVRGEEPSVVREYLRAYKRNFKTATACFAVLAVLGMLIILDFRLIGVFSGAAYAAVRFLLAVILGLWFLELLYIFPYIARFENTVVHSLKNALFLSAAHIPSTLVLAGLLSGSVILTLFTSRTFVLASIIWFFVGFAFLSYVQSFLLCRIFQKYE